MKVHVLESLMATFLLMLALGCIIVLLYATYCLINWWSIIFWTLFLITWVCVHKGLSYLENKGEKTNDKI